MAETSDKDTGKRGWIVPVAGAAILGLVALYGLYVAQQSGRTLNIKFGDKELSLGADSDLSDVLDAAIKENETTFEAILSTKGFYKISSPLMVDALARLDGTSDSDRTVTAGIRKLLWNLDGPFKGPGTLSEADERFMQALVELDQPFDASSGDKGKLIIELWQRSLERESPLGLRIFKAKVVPARADGAGRSMVYLCPGSTPRLAEKSISVFTGDAKPIDGVLEEDTRGRMACDGPRTTLENLFAGATLTLGVDPDRYRQLADPQATGEVLPEQIDAFFEVQPRHHVAEDTDDSN